jgi:hypothetical protein
MSLDPTPISAIASAWDATMALIAKILPSDAQRLAAFQMRYPLRYAKIRIKIENRIYNQIAHDCRLDRMKVLNKALIVDYVEFDNPELPQSEKASLVNILCDRFRVS